MPEERWTITVSEDNLGEDPWCDRWVDVVVRLIDGVPFDWPPMILALRGDMAATVAAMVDGSRTPPEHVREAAARHRDGHAAPPAEFRRALALTPFSVAWVQGTTGMFLTDEAAARDMIVAMDDDPGAMEDDVRADLVRVCYATHPAGGWVSVVLPEQPGVGALYRIRPEAPSSPGWVQGPLLGDLLAALTDFHEAVVGR